MRAPSTSFAHARRLRRQMTLPEVLMWQAMRRSALSETRFRRQHPIGPYVLDFYAPRIKLAVEIDGAAHDIASVVARDVKRDLWLSAQGITVLRFNASDILDAERRFGVLETISAKVVEQRARKTVCVQHLHWPDPH